MCLEDKYGELGKIDGMILLKTLGILITLAVREVVLLDGIGTLHLE
jgi:hypothetical protein